MQNNKSFIKPFLGLILALFLNPPSFAEPTNLSLLQKEIETYHDSGAYQKEFANVMAKAKDFIITRTKANIEQAHPQKLAVVLDIDETSLSNYESMVARKFGGAGKPWHKEVLAANAPAIKPMLSFYNMILKRGITVFFVTGRTESERLATDKNLKYAGYHDWAGLYLKPKQYKHASAIPFKSDTRARITQQGYTIIASIGDQYSDLKGGYAEKLFKLPNPYYHIP